jgi:error-prone DNA polymerase
MKYVELHARSAFSFLRGSSNPEDLVKTASALGFESMALCDRDGVYGSARIHAKGKELGVKAHVGAELTIEGGHVLPVLVRNRTGYQNLCRIITEAKLRGTKTESFVRWDELPAYSEGLLTLTGDEEGPLRDMEDEQSPHRLDQLITAFGRENVFVEIQRHLRRGEEIRNSRLIDLAHSRKLPLVATNGVLHATPSARAALDVFTCIRHHTHLDAAGRLLSRNAERHLKSAAEMATLFADLSEAIVNTARVADRLDFTLENLGYEFPKYPIPANHTMDSFLRERTMEGARKRYGALSTRVLEQLNKELTIIASLNFSGYFLIVWDICEYCRANNILMQGRGSAANSAVCYSLGITAFDPIGYDLLFERFLSQGHGEDFPDIDLDLPSGDKREQVIQEVYQRYGKHGAAMTANVITYRGRSAMREIGKALNFSPDIIDRFSRLYSHGDHAPSVDLSGRLREAGLPTDHPRTAAAMQLYNQIHGLPRHLGQHSGGMIICQGTLNTIVPLENASMPGRVVAQWDKNDCADLKIVKVDLLGLGMMAAIEEAVELCAQRGHPFEIHSLPPDDPKVYDLLQRADTVGTFQVESRAQMATLPRLWPVKFYDIAVQVAIVRPGPIEGGMVNSYLDRRRDKSLIDYPCENKDVKEVLKRTLGVPLFQEQMLKMAMVLADFSGSEAAELRRALSFHRSHEKMIRICAKLEDAMRVRHVPEKAIDRIIKSVQSFSVYGFPESHAISFAMIAYISCWLKVNRTEEFYTSLLNNQPMGFYSSSTLIRDAKERGVKFRPVSVLHSDWRCTIDENGAIRLGLCMVRSLNEKSANELIAERHRQPFSSLEDLRLRWRLDKPVWRTLARIGALNGLVEHRREGLWQVETPIHELGQLLSPTQTTPLRPMDAFERLDADLTGTGVTTGAHPMALIRHTLPDIPLAADLPHYPNGTFIQIAGLVICRQRPGTAKGYVFISLEDETGVSNAVLTPKVFEKYRIVTTQSAFLSIYGILQTDRGIPMIKARRVELLPYHAVDTPKSYDFH